MLPVEDRLWLRVDFTNITFFVTFMKSTRRNAMTGPSFLQQMAASGRYHFTMQDAMKALGASVVAVHAVLRRLKKQGLLAMPVRGFYVIVPPEYRSLGCLPAEQFVPALMDFLDVPYYVGLLSAAERHGAAHQRPQEFQVVTSRNRAPLVSGSVRVAFVARGNVRDVPTVTLNSPRGFLRVSTPEATALDLVTYPEKAGGLDTVATVLAELAETLDARALADVAARVGEVPAVQRLGHLLDAVGGGSQTAFLADLVANRARRVVRLVPAAPLSGAPLDARWRVRANATIEVDE
jgi:predicted transcriptional regulator of viral defense system